MVACALGCGGEATPARGHDHQPTVCLKCSLAELGETQFDLRGRTNKGITKKKWATLQEEVDRTFRKLAARNSPY